ncbi:fimbrial assembly protein PilO [Dissulfurispira thermophila]|uniref:Fimbrial assembly protein PilO n=1 Tax=Dissulfurispira thermophila TaxID=2715679 RepID=A0A7G1GZQ9_9BACT|nr:type 4a pilus biogenesis protein PilO [Dissulfurispira thermophila]BCB95499.1 fimbrial assembly protein PilO [Dissulfurispira thermophila]
MAFKLGFDIETMSPNKRKVLLVLLSLVIIILFGVLLIMPAFEERTKLIAEIDKQKSEIQVAQKNAAKLSTLIAENERLKGRLFELQMQIPEEKEVSGLLKQVSELGIKSGLQIVSWKPKAKAVHSSKEVYEIPVEVEMRGNYHRLGQFFSNITKLSRVVNISNISIKTGVQKQKTATLNVSFTLMTYSFIPEKERKALEAASKEKKKEKKK